MEHSENNKKKNYSGTVKKQERKATKEELEQKYSENNKKGRRVGSSDKRPINRHRRSAEMRVNCEVLVRRRKLSSPTFLGCSYQASLSIAWQKGISAKPSNTFPCLCPAKTKRFSKFKVREFSLLVYLLCLLHHSTLSCVGHQLASCSLLIRRFLSLLCTS